jgi:NitT/TauT family transport system permease protein
MKKLNNLFNLILPLITIGCFLVVWSIVAVVQNDEYVVPTVSSTLQEFFKLFAESNFYLYLGQTVLRSVIAFLLSFLISSVLAYCATKQWWAEKIILTFISITRAFPTIAIAWLLLFWTNNQVAPVVITMLVVLPTSYTHVKSALESVNKNTIDAGKVDGAGCMNIFFRIELAQIMPDVYSVIGSGLALNFKLMVAAEVLSATLSSIGTMLNLSRPFEVARTLALTVVVLIIGLAVEFIFNKLSKKSGQWK